MIGDFVLTQEQIDFIYEDLRAGFHHVWDYVGEVHGVSSVDVDPNSFEERRNDFFFALGKLLDEGKLKLGHRKDEVIIEGPTEELVERFRQCFPASDEALEAGLWFFADCPFVAAWLFTREVEGEPDEDDYGWCF
ncbi:hypothetical protein AF72_13495 [Xylella taiwanensis]|uniref:DUF596 domain-containing protein n=1 Tax=Xylella taiwanensis TaxID=1444770 RepID=Z9JGR3_9GAMM|nr:DUF596 domain-containing protein [Xylella taiwanensis]EWS76942.1 hypothetical protein AF72_13495 [Xylella taiwanensis]